LFDFIYSDEDNYSERNIFYSIDFIVVFISFKIWRIGWTKSGDLSMGAFSRSIDFLINVKVLRIDEPTCPENEE